MQNLFRSDEPGTKLILKGYVDRVYSYGYGSDGNIEKLLTGEKGIIINTYGTPSEIYDAIGMTEALKKTSDTGILEFCSIKVLGHLLFGSVPQVNDATRKGMLKQVEDTLNSLV